MKKNLFLALVTMVVTLFVGAVAYATEVGSQVSLEQLTALAVKAMTEGGLTWVVFGVQFVIFAVWKFFPYCPKKYKIVGVSLLTIVPGVVGLVQGGSGWTDALLHSTTIAAYQVFGHQLFTQLFKKDN